MGSSHAANQFNHEEYWTVPEAKELQKKIWTNIKELFLVLIASICVSIMFAADNLRIFFGITAFVALFALLLIIQKTLEMNFVGKKIQEAQENRDVHVYLNRNSEMRETPAIS